MAHTLNNIGSVRLTLGDTDGAVSMYERRYMAVYMSMHVLCTCVWTTGTDMCVGMRTYMRRYIHVYTVLY